MKPHARRILLALFAVAIGSARAQASPAPAPKKPATLAEFLKKELGAKFHPRADWAGGDYPIRAMPPRTWEPIGAVKYITLHQAEGIPLKSPSRMIREIYIGHTALDGNLGGAPDVGYHLFVDRNGEVWEGRDAAKKGSHVKSTPAGLNNEGNLGICALDTFDYTDPIKPIWDSTLKLCELLCKFEGRTLQVTGHQDWRGINQKNNSKPLTWCPGNLEKLVPVAQKRLIELYGPIPKATRVIPVAQEGRFAPGRPKPKAKPKSAIAASSAARSPAKRAATTKSAASAKGGSPTSAPAKARPKTPSKTAAKPPAKRPT